MSGAKSPATVPSREPNRPSQYSTARLSSAFPVQDFVHCSYLTICFPCVDTPFGQGWVGRGRGAAPAPPPPPPLGRHAGPPYDPLPREHPTRPDDPAAS